MEPASSPATGLLASGGKEGDLKFWRGDVRPSRELWTRMPAKLKHNPGTVGFTPGSLAGSPDSTTFAVTEESEQGEAVVRLWDAKRMERWPDACPMQNVRALAFSPDGREIILGTSNGLVRAYSRTSHQLTARQFDLGDLLFMIKSVHGGKQFVVVGSSKLAILEADTWRVLREISLPVSSRRILCAAVNATGTRLLRHGSDGSMDFTDIQTGRTIRNQLSPGGGVAFLADGRHAAFVDGSARPVAIWDTATQTQVRQLRGHLLSGHGVGLSSDGQRIITGST